MTQRFPSDWLTYAGIDASRIPTVPQPAYPPEADRYRALELVGPDATRVVILGQDPYHDEGQAHGLAFSVPQTVRIPPSLRNIFRELASDMKIVVPTTGDLTNWADEGVLLLNTALSVEPHRAGSHADIGWSYVTDCIVRSLGNSSDPKAFIFWGKSAQLKSNLINPAHGHLVLCAPHPSPLSAHRGFFGSRPFSQVNVWLKHQGKPPIEWAPAAPNAR